MIAAVPVLQKFQGCFEDAREATRLCMTSRQGLAMVGSRHTDGKLRLASTRWPLHLPPELPHDLTITNVDIAARNQLCEPAL